MTSIIRSLIKKTHFNFILYCRMGKSWEKALPTKRGSHKQIFERQSRQEDVGWSGRGANLCSGRHFGPPKPSAFPTPTQSDILQCTI